MILLRAFPVLVLAVAFVAAETNRRTVANYHRHEQLAKRDTTTLP